MVEYQTSSLNYVMVRRVKLIAPDLCLPVEGHHQRREPPPPCVRKIRQVRQGRQEKTAEAREMRRRVLF